MRALSRAGAFIAVIVAALGTAANADVVSDWSEFADAMIAAARAPDAPFDAAAVQGPTKAALAIFEAVDSIDRRYASWLKLPLAAPGADPVIAAATAAHDVLLACYPSQHAAIDDRYALALAEAPGAGGATGRAAGIAAGKAAALAALATGGVDPAVKVVPYWPKAPAGQWTATAPTVIDAAYLSLRPWFMTSSTQFRPGPPVALTSARWLHDVDEVRRMGGKTSSERSASDTVLARFWAPYDSAPALRAVAAQPGRSLVRNARFYAMTAMIDDDASLALVEAKFHYGFWRPISAIRAGGGNPAATADPQWQPLLATPLHPEYPCGHCVDAAARAAVIEAEGPPPAGGLPFSNAKMPGFVVTVATPAEYVRQVSFSRICGGVHYRSTAEASEAMARRIAAYALAKFAPPLN